MRRVPFETAQDVAASLEEVVAHLRCDGLIAYPTETVYGFGGLITARALAALSDLKSRDEKKPFLLLIREIDDMPELVWTTSGRKLAELFWPGPLTLALRVQGEFHPRILSEYGTVAVRATPHEAIRSLLQRLGTPITSTSANMPRQSPATSADRIEAVLGELRRDDVMILDGGEIPASPPSTLIDCSTEPPRAIRAGAIPLAAISEVVDLQ